VVLQHAAKGVLERGKPAHEQAHMVVFGRRTRSLQRPRKKSRRPSTFSICNVQAASVGSTAGELRKN
jgi:hypothetical protein